MTTVKKVTARDLMKKIAKFFIYNQEKPISFPDLVKTLAENDLRYETSKKTFSELLHVMVGELIAEGVVLRDEDRNLSPTR